MKSLVIVLLSFLFTVNVSAEDEIQDPAIEVATNYFTSLAAGDVETADKLVGVPFRMFSDDNILMNIAAIKVAHREIVEQQGERPVPNTEITKPLEYEELNKDIFKGEYEVVKFTLLEGQHRGETILFYIQNIDGKYSVISLEE